jgi:hypothetical protein
MNLISVIPTQISLEWGWMNQWYQGVKIGPDVYHFKPFDFFFIDNGQV